MKKLRNKDIPEFLEKIGEQKLAETEKSSAQAQNK